MRGEPYPLLTLHPNTDVYHQSSCSLKEAAIVASVLSKVSVPVLHSAAALLRLASMDYTGASSFGSIVELCELTFCDRSQLVVH